MSLKIIIETVPHNIQRYNTCGDWQVRPDGVHIFVSEMPVHGEYGEFLIAIHEMVEMMICRWNGVTEESVDMFDENYKGDYDEPGDDPTAPYNREHSIATGIERILATQLDMVWAEYDREIQELSDSYPEEK